MSVIKANTHQVGSSSTADKNVVMTTNADGDLIVSKGTHDQPATWVEVGRVTGTGGFQSNTAVMATAAAVQNTDLMTIAQGGVNKKITAGTFRTEFATEAVAAKVAAEAARDAAQLSAGVYATTAAGIAATTNGKYFSVPSDQTNEYLILYLNNSGTAVEVKRYPSAALVSNINSRLTPIEFSLSSYELTKLANYFPNGGVVPASTGTYWPSTGPSAVTVNGPLAAEPLTPTSNTDLNAMGLYYMLNVGTTETNRHAIIELPTNIGGQWLIMSWITYAPSGDVGDHGSDAAYVGKNGSLGDGYNGCTDITRGYIDVSSQVRIHWLKCKLFTTYTSAQAWVGGTVIGGSGQNVYMTGFNVAFTPNSAVTIADTNYNKFAPYGLPNSVTKLNRDVQDLRETKYDIPIPKATVFQNAVTDRYGSAFSDPTKHKSGYAADANLRPLQYPYEPSAYHAVGDYNCIKATSNTAGQYYPSMTIQILPADLAAIGIVPNNTTPPRVSFRAGMLDKGDYQDPANHQIFFLLQYSDSALSQDYNSGTDVLFINESGTAAYIGAGDTSWNHTSVKTQGSTDGTAWKIYTHNNVPIPATYLGKPFRGIKIMCLAYNTNLTAVEKQIYGFAFACIAGSSISPTAKYHNIPQDAPGYVGYQDIAHINTELDRLDEIDSLRAQILTKVPGYDNVSFVNAVKNRFGLSGGPVSSNIGGCGTVTYYRDEAMFTQDGVRTVLKSVYPKRTIYYPMITTLVTLQDLADIGIVPNDANPPKISMKAAFVKSLCTQHNTYGIQIFFSLRFGSALSYEYQPSTDVLLNTAFNFGLWIGAGDPLWNHTAGTYSDSLKQGYYHSNVPVPASYKGQPLTGIVISVLGYPTVNDNADVETTIGMTDVAVVAGTSIQTLNAPYLNYPDDYPKVGNIQQNQLSTELQNNLVFKSELGDTINTITIKNSDKVTLLGDSYSSSHYTMKDKAYVSRMAELSDWRFENYSRSGDDYAEINQRILANTNDYASVGFKDLGSSHALMISFTNDVYYRARNLDYFNDNVRRLAQTIMACGTKPILATEFVAGNSQELMGLSNIARELGIEYIDIASNANIFDQTRYAQFWGGGHPAARTNGLFYDPLLPYFNARRPRQGIKIFRKRPTFSVSTDSDLLYDNIQQRVKKWKEITIGHHSLVPRLEPYYDRMTDIANDHGGYSYNANQSEYVLLQNKQPVTFGDYALVEVIVPTTAANINGLDLFVSNSTVQVYTRNVLQTETFNAYSKYQAFQVDTIPTVNVGDTYTFNANTYTVVGTTTTPENENIVIMSPFVDFSGGSGTLTRASGTGAATISFTSRFAGYDPQYYADLYKPRGVWTQVTNNLGKISLDAAAVQKAMQYDKLVFMLKKTGGFNLSDIYVQWYGETAKDAETFKNVAPIVGQKPAGTQVLTSTKFDAVGSWTYDGGIVAQDPADGVLPRGCTKLIKVNGTKKANQQFTITGDTRYAKELDIVVWARRFPAEFIPSSNETTAASQYVTAPITSDTCDYATLRVQIDAGSSLSAVKVDELVGLHWKEVRVRLQLPNAGLAGATHFIRLNCLDDELEIALAEVWVY